MPRFAVSGVLRRRDFRHVFGASVVSLLGDSVVPVALAFAVLDLTHSATDLGIVLAAQTVALVGSLLVGGVVADRLGRRAVMIGADLARLETQAVIAVLLIEGQATVAEIAISQALLGAATGFFNPASSGLIPAVAGGQLREANAHLGLAQALARVLGPAIAGGLVVAAGPGAALLIDAGSYGVSAILLAQVRPVATSRSAVMPSRSFVGELRDGFDEFRSRTWVWTMILGFSLLNLFAAAFPVLGPVVAKQALGGAGSWAAILVARGIGGIVGATALLRISPTRPLRTAVLCCATAPVPSLLLGIPAPLAVLLPVTFLSGVGPMMFNTLWETTLQQHVPEHARSRVSSYDWFGSLALAPVGFALVGPLAAAIGVSAALYLCGAAELGLLGSMLSVRDVRRLRAPAGSAIPEWE